MSQRASCVFIYQRHATALSKVNMECTFLPHYLFKIPQGKRSRLSVGLSVCDDAVECGQAGSSGRLFSPDHRPSPGDSRKGANVSACQICAFTASELCVSGRLVSKLSGCPFLLLTFEILCSDLSV